jgi:hypothetical protein
MPDLMIPLFGHHLIPLLSLPGAAGALGGKAHLAAVKDTCKSAERIHGALKMAGRYEVAVVSDDIDFFDPSPGMTKARNVAWETIRMTQRLQWVIPTRNTENISSSLPPTGIGKGFQNVCLGLVADGGDGLSEKLEALRKAPVQHRIILLSPYNPAIDLSGHLGGIDWVVLSGNSENSSRAALIEAACREANVAFLFHQIDRGLKSGPTDDSHDDMPPWPAHPFGTKIELFQPTLPDLKPVITSKQETFSQPAHVENNPEPSSSAEMKVIDSPVKPSPESPGHTSEQPSEIVKFEVVSPETTIQEPNSAPPPPTVTDDAHQEFARLDGVVRRGLGTFKEVGHALAEIRDRELWLAGGHTSWAAYCHAVGGLTKTHANRLINSSEIANHLTRVTPIGVTPSSESQVRPLCRLKTQETQAAAWSRAVKRASGSPPTAKQISGVVAELMADDSTPAAAKTNYKQQVATAIGRLRASVASKDPVEQIDGLITELEKLLKIA